MFILARDALGIVCYCLAFLSGTVLIAYFLLLTTLYPRATLLSWAIENNFADIGVVLVMHNKINVDEVEALHVPAEKDTGAFEPAGQAFQS